MSVGDDRVELLRRIDLRQLLVELGDKRGLRARRTRFPCPSTSHDQTGRSPPASVGTKSGYDVWHCHGCGGGGSAVDALIAAGQARDIAEAFAQLRGERGFNVAPPVRVARPRETPEALRPEDIAAARRILTAYVDHCHWRLYTDEAKEGLAWLHGRGLTDEEIAVHRIGFDPGRHRLPRRPGRLPPTPGPAITLPLFDERGAIVYAQARPLDTTTVESKYLNPYADWIGPSPRLGSIHSPPTVDRSVVVVGEGYLDSIVAGRYFETKVLIGAGQPDESVFERLVATANGRPIVSALHPDAAGRAGNERLRAGIADHGGGPITSLSLPGMDINDMLREAPNELEGRLRELVVAALAEAGIEHSLAPGDANDPLIRCRDLLGNDRLRRFDDEIARRARSITGHPATLRERREALRPLLKDPEPKGAYETLRIEVQRRELTKRLESEQSEAAELQVEAKGVSGWERELVEDRARVARLLADQDRNELAQLDNAEQHLRKDGTHLDNWTRDHFDNAAEWFALNEVLDAPQRELQPASETSAERDLTDVAELGLET